MHMQCNERNKETHEITLDVHITLYVCVWLTHTYNVMWTSRVISHVSLFFTLHCTCVTHTHMHMQCNERNKETHEITLDVHITLYVCVADTRAQCDVDIKSYFTCFFITYITLYVCECHTHAHAHTCTCNVMREIKKHMK